MPDHSPQEIRPGSPPSGEGGLFSLKKFFPGEPATAPPPFSPSSRSGKRVLTQVVLPLALLVLVIGGVTYVMQNLPSWRKDSRTGSGGAMLRFASQKGYAGEFERGVDGTYHYFFDNPSNTLVYLGLMESSCDCSKVQAAILEGDAAKENAPDQPDVQPKVPANAAWQQLRNDKKKEGVDSIAVPPGGKGLVRIHWNGRKTDAAQLSLKVILWAQPKGAGVKERQLLPLYTSILLVSPVLFEHDSIDLGPLSLDQPVKRKFACWSATRDKLDLGLKNTDPLFEWELTPLSEEDRKSLQQRKSMRVKTGHWVHVTAHGKKGDQQLEQGSFIRYAPLKFKDGEPMDTRGPEIQGELRGEVDIKGTAKTGGVFNGQVRFGEFPVNQGTEAKLILRADKNLGLELLTDPKKPAFLPAYMQVHLVETREIVDNKKVWHLEIVVPGQGPAGPMPPDSMIRLATQTTPPRHINIPVLGNATQYGQRSP